MSPPQRATERAAEIDAQLKAPDGTVLDDDITFEPAQAPIVRAGERVGPEARRTLNETMVEYMSRLENESNPESENIQADYDARIGKLKSDIEAIAQKIVSESGGEDVLKASAAERIKKLESIDMLSEMEARPTETGGGGVAAA